MTGRVTAAAGKRILSFDLKRIKGQEVDFAEQGKGVKDVISVSAQGNGALRFKPALGAGRKRTVIAIVTQDGVPREEIEVEKFVAPPSLPGRPQGVTLTRKGTKLVVGWRSAPGASRVAVSWALADGRQQAEVVKGGKHPRSRACRGSTPARSRSPGCVSTTSPAGR